MVAVVAKIFLVKLFLPLFFLVGAALRPSFISLGYVLLALTCNVLPTSKINGPFPKVTRVFTFLCVILTLAITLVQFGYQLYQHFDHPEEEEYVELCNKSTFVYWTRQIGFIRVPATTDPNALRLFFPELLALFGSLVTFIACTAYPTDLSLTASTDRQPLEAEEHLETTLENDQQQTRAQLVQGPTSKNYADIVNVASKRTSDACVVFSICIIGMLSPSLLNAPYFLFTLVSLTWWALYTPLRRSKFNAMKQALLIYSAFHFVFLYTYQIEFFQENVPSTGIEARLIGLSALVLPSDCEKWYELVVNWNLGWIPYANLASVLVLYYVLTLQYRWTKEGVKQKHSPSGNRNSAQTGTGDDLQEGLLSNTREIESTDAIALQRITSEVMDRQKISQLIRSRRESEPGFMLIRAAQEFLYFSLYHCYVFALLAMLMWAMLYHSVFGLIFLVLTCFLWALVDSRNWTFRMSPLLLAYVEFLILTQYVCSMNFLPDELQLSQAMNIIGFKLEKTRIDAFLALLLKALLSIPFFVLLRLHLREHFYNSLSARDRLQQINYGTFDESPTSARKNLVQRVARKFSLDGEERPFAWISRLLTKYWIFLVAFCILINSPIPQHLDPKINEDNLFNIGFFIFFVALILILNVSFRLFQNIIFAFFTLLIIYSSVVLVSIYCYQFDGIPALWHNWTHLSEEQDASIGLTVYSKGEFGNLFKDLIKLITLIVVTMLQLKFFHSPWLRLVQMRDAASHVGDDVECADAARIDIRSLIMRATQIWSDFKELLWRCAEVHLHKFVLFILLVVCVNHFCALNLVPVIFISLALCSSAISPLVSFSTCVYLGMVFIARRIYQLPIVPPISSLVNETANCSDVVGDDARKEFDSFEKWIGLSKQYTDEDDWLAGDIYGFITVLILIGMQLAIRYRQVHSRKLRGLPEPEQGIIFVGHEPGNFDKSLVDCAKFLLNYGFYKFGIEISFVAMAFVAWFRMDCLAALLMLWLLVLFPMTRSGRKRVWPLLVFYLAIVFPLQYAMAIGLPTNLCIGYPWTWWKPVDLNGWVLLNNNLLYFLGLPNYRKEAARFLPNLLVDFILLAVVAAQKRVFLKEGEHHPAGSNESIYKNGKYELFKQNPRYDFVVEQRSFVDFFKYFIFMYGHWCTMIMVLGAGLGGTSVFALGYLILAFWMLWKGNNLYTMQNYQRTLARWDILSMYTITVMCCKVLIQVVGCAFIGLLFHRCGIQQLFGIFCVDNKLSEELKAFFELNEKVPVVQNVSKCATTESHSEAKIGFDALAFLFIIFQLRILQSWFFQRCMIEFRCEIIQANRGAVLINQLVEKEMREQTEQQNRKLREIQDRTAAIRKRYEEQQRRSSGSNYFLPQTYGQVFRRSLSLTGVRPPSTIIDEDDPLPSYDPRYAPPPGTPAKRAGDYYMFDYGPDTDELVEPVQSFVPEVTPGAGDFDKLDPAQLLHTALGKDLNLTGTLDSVEEAEQIKDEKLRMIAAVAPSKKAREIAKLALIQRHEKRGSLDAVEEDQQPQTSSSAKAREVPDMPLIQMRKKTAEEEENIEKEEEETRPDGNVEEEQTWGQTVSSLIRFVWKMFLAVLGWAAAFLNRRSREHRYVSYVLNKEKERLKELMDDELFTSQISNAELRTKWEQQNMHMVSSEADIRRLENEAHNRWEERNIFARFVTAIGNSVSAHTDIICYAFAVFVHGHTAGLISLPLPALIFFWGTLANPRPSKYFWIVMIFYTEFEIVVKFLFQFGFWPWNTTTDLVQNTAKTYKTQYVFGVQKADYFAVPDVALLIALFFHRYMLRKLGLWRDANSDQLSVSQGGGGKAMKKGTSNEGSSQKSGQISPNTQSTATASNGEVGYQAGEETVQIQEIDVEKGETRGTNDALEIKGQANSEGEPLGVVCHFFDKLIHPKFRYIRDFYPLMFFLDVICMLIVVFGYNSFGEGSSGDVVNDIKSNKIPIPLVVIILIQSMMIVIDRGLYLRKAVVCKLGYHLLTVCLVHIWILFILPSFTHREAHDNTLARYLYFIKCIYFLVSAWQIRNGYPSLCIGNLLTHSYGLVNMVLFKIFMLTPFVFELRTAIDWTWTDTSMPIFDFFNMENFYAVIYNLKCARKFEESFPAPRGEAKGRVIKYMMGLPLIIFLIFLVWSPIIMFALINTIGNIQMPESVQMSVGLEGYPPVYKMEAKGDQIASISVVQYDELVKIFSNMDSRLTEPSVQDRSRAAVYYISQYTQMDILRVRFRPESESSWQISSESMDALKTALQDSQRPLKISVQMEFKRPASEKKDPQVHSATFKADINNTNLYEALNSPGSWFETTNLLPMYLSIPSQGEAQTAKVLYEAAVRKQKNSPLPPLNSSYNTWRMKLSGPVQDSSYWITQVDLNANMTELNILPPEHVNYGTDRNLNYTEFIAMVDRVFPSWLDSYVQGGIILMYAGVVLLVGRLLRGFVSSQPLDVIINEIPNPDYLLKICLDIYLVREASDFVLEQDLFAKLIFLFRSPQTLIRWTRYKTKNE